LSFLVLCTLCCQFLWTVDIRSWLPLRYYLTFMGEDNLIFRSTWCNWHFCFSKYRLVYIQIPTKKTVDELRCSRRVSSSRHATNMASAICKVCALYESYYRKQIILDALGRLIFQYQFLGGNRTRVAQRFCFLCCLIMCLYVQRSHKNDAPLVFTYNCFRKVHVLLAWLVFVCIYRKWCSTHIVVFLLCLSWSLQHLVIVSSNFRFLTY
jgi:hypothetical protein